MSDFINNELLSKLAKNHGTNYSFKFIAGAP